MNTVLRQLFDCFWFSWCFYKVLHGKVTTKVYWRSSLKCGLNVSKLSVLGVFRASSIQTFTWPIVYSLQGFIGGYSLDSIQEDSRIQLPGVHKEY